MDLSTLIIKLNYTKHFCILIIRTNIIQFHRIYYVRQVKNNVDILTVLNTLCILFIFSGTIFHGSQYLEQAIYGWHHAQVG